MLNLFSFLGAATDDATGVVDDIATSAYDVFIGVVNIVLPIIMAILLTLGIILGVKVGIAFAKAEDEEAKKKAKGQLVNIVIGFLTAIIFTAIIYVDLAERKISVQKLFTSKNRRSFSSCFLFVNLANCMKSV